MKETTDLKGFATPTENARADNVSIESNALIVDGSFRLIAVGDRIRLAAGSAKRGDAVYSFIAPDDLFRFERFVLLAAPYDAMATVEIALRGVPGFATAVAARAEMFGTNTVILRCYKSKNELLASEVTQFYERSFPSGTAGQNRIEKARRIINRAFADRPRDARALDRAFTDVVRHSLTSEMICAIVTAVRDHDDYDVSALAKQAAGYVGGMLCRKIAVSDLRESTRFSGHADVCPEHMWYLCTAALGAALAISKSAARLVISSDGDGIRFEIRTASKALAASLPETLRLGELREIVPRSALKLFLCELICDENGIASEIVCENGGIAISFTVPLTKDEREFHSTAPAVVQARWLALTEAVIIPDDM